MGQSTDAILFWGYCWDEEKASPWFDEESGDGEETAERRHARMRGIVEPTGPYPPDADEGPDAATRRAEFSAYWEKERVAWAAARMEVGSHCSASCPMPYVAIAESHTRAWRGYPKPITSLDVGADWSERLDAFCALMGIKPPLGQKPQWWLVSDWN